jgi:hypothetical protein
MESADKDFIFVIAVGDCRTVEAGSAEDPANRDGEQYPINWEALAPDKPSLVARELDSPNVFRLRAFLAPFGFELNPVPLSQGAEAFTAYCGVMDKNVFAPVIWSDEAKSLGIIEPLHSSFHCALLGLQIMRR